MLSCLARMVLVGMAHSAIFVLFYYQRITHGFLLFDSDIVVFLVPTLLACAGYFMVTWYCGVRPQRFATRITIAVLIALAATAVSSVGAMTYAFGKFGT